MDHGRSTQLESWKVIGELLVLQLTILSIVALSLFAVSRLPLSVSLLIALVAFSASWLLWRHRRSLQSKASFIRLCAGGRRH